MMIGTSRVAALSRKQAVASHHVLDLIALAKILDAHLMRASAPFVSPVRPVPETLESAKRIVNGHNPGRDMLCSRALRRASADKSNQTRN